MDQNNFDLHPICRHPMTGEWPAPGDEMLDLTNFSIADGVPPLIVFRQTELIEIPDEWVLPVVNNGLPPKPNQKIQRYILSEEGFVANRARLEKGYRYQKCTFEEFAHSVVGNARHYKRTLAKRTAKELDIHVVNNDGSQNSDRVCIIKGHGLHWGLTLEGARSLHEQLALIIKKHSKE